MSQIECLREKLYNVIESGDYDTILQISQELDLLILNYMSNQLVVGKKPA